MKEKQELEFFMEDDIKLCSLRLDRGSLAVEVRENYAARLATDARIVKYQIKAMQRAKLPTGPLTAFQKRTKEQISDTADILVRLRKSRSEDAEELFIRTLILKQFRG